MAPDITPGGPAARGWTEEAVRQFVRTSIAPQGSAFSEMHLVASLSTQYLNERDLHALARFTMGDSAPPPQVHKEDLATDRHLGNGRQLYMNACAGYHGLEGDGDGQPHLAVARRGNSTLRQADARNLVTAILDGVPT